MNLSESYKKRIQELAGVNGETFPHGTKEEYEKQKTILGIENFEDLIGRTVYYIKPTYGEHKVIKWYPERKEYLLFTDGNRVWASPFSIIPISEKTEKETDSELKWVITKLCENKVKDIKIKDYYVNENAELVVSFDIFIEDFSQVLNIKEEEKIIILYSNTTLKLYVDEKKELKGFLIKNGHETIIQGNVYEKWTTNHPFTLPNYRTTDTDWHYMKKIVERIILENI